MNVELDLVPPLKRGTVNFLNTQYSYLNTILYPLSFILYPLSFILSLKQKPDPDATSQYERRVAGG